MNSSVMSKISRSENVLVITYLVLFTIFFLELTRQDMDAMIAKMKKNSHPGITCIVYRKPSNLKVIYNNFIAVFNLSIRLLNY